ncbi:MAG TPA: SidA/IucD/PvdA family monooxygenase [Jatrophihabitans sp.]|nr:SidA/IucD/PvdA family monooxygenase [Jatrophihabitans sp.]
MPDLASMEQPASAPLVGIGFGPAGIALSAAMTDDALHGVPGADPRAAAESVFFERADDSAWQPGMVLPGTDIQHHFLRDFGTPRYPGSHFGFVRFLQDADRFYPFTLRGGYVSRAEWSAYCQWAAQRTESQVAYGHEVISVEPVHADGLLQAVRVHARDWRSGAVRQVETTRLVLGTGHEPYVPEEFVPLLGERVFHSTAFSQRWPQLAGEVRSALVLGGGQNAGEILLHLYHATDLELFSVVRNSGFRLYDLGHFANQAYWPAETDYFHRLPAAARGQIFDEQYRTNYAAVDPDVSTGLYNAWYDGEVSGNQRLHMIKRHQIVEAELAGPGVRVVVQDRYTGETRELNPDVVVLSTGFREQPVPRVLDPLREHLTVEEDGKLAATRDYRTPLRAAGDVAVYLNGMTESRHGIATATSFSLLALRAGEIAHSLRTNTRTRENAGALS